MYKTQPLSDTKAELLVKCLLMEQEKGDIKIDEKDLHLLGRIIQKRIDVLGLPIKFTNIALLSVGCFCEVAGGAVVLLIDCLNKFPNETITVGKLCEVYPDGFYTESELERYVETDIKTRKINFSDLY